MYMFPIPDSFQDRAISLYSSKVVDKKEIWRTVCDTGIYFSSDKVGTVFLVQYIFKKSVNISALCSSCEGMTCCLSEWILMFLYAGDNICSSMSETYAFLLRITDTMTFQNIDLSSGACCICNYTLIWW
jgi:hypothetical protein